MTSIQHVFSAIRDVLAGHPVGGFTLVLALVAMLHAMVAIGRTRGWYVLPVLFGLTALAGFMLNPFADANTAMDLRMKLTGYEALMILCIVQFLLVAASIAIGFRLSDSKGQDRGALSLAVVHTIPAPVLLIAMLLIEQTALTASASARPEAVGRAVGLVVATVLTLISAAAMLLPRRWLAGPHYALSAALLLASMFVPFLVDPLPQSMAMLNWESLGLLGWVAPIAAGIVLVGCFWSRVSSRHIVRPGNRRSVRRIGLDRTLNP